LAKAFSGLIESLANAFARIGSRCYIQQPLLRLHILHDGRGFALNGEDDGAPTLLELHHEIARAASEGS
jgi:hypothetical protein